MDEARLFDLLSWMSPAWPVGAFAHSGGLEWAVEAGDVHDRDTTVAWITDLVERGALWNDLVLFRHAFAARRAGDDGALAAVADLTTASATGAERRLETVAQGGAFRRIARTTLGGAAFAPLDALGDDHLAYPVAAACLMAHEAMPLAAALAGFAHGVAANLVSAAQRLVPLGQSDGQRALHGLKPVLLAAATRAAALPPEDDPFTQIGGMALASEIACMAHETQYTRLFRT
ncbi:urease accessory protein UreF [Sphingomonas populi]|uniref:Urease accessory protein UreF n=2 Tax=Sphingomonas populi TaxID=2484750 RepID=A0A4Q6XSQ2_9SPHN|nr:urease accessory protein UreF [Sphingomonas populi]